MYLYIVSSEIRYNMTKSETKPRDRYVNFFSFLLTQKLNDKICKYEV